MRRRLLATLAAIVTMASLVFIPGQALALTRDPLADACEHGGGSSICENTNSGNPLFGPNGIITKVTQLVTTALGVVAVIMIIVGGIKYITANGDSAGISSAKQTILGAIIGLVIALAAQAIVLLVMRKI